MLDNVVPFPQIRVAVAGSIAVRNRFNKEMDLGGYEYPISMIHIHTSVTSHAKSDAIIHMVQVRNIS